MTEFLKVLNLYGFPLAVLLLLGAFVHRKVWPFFCTQWEDSQKRRDRTFAQFARINAELVGALRKIDGKIDAGFKDVRDEIKRVKQGEREV